MKTNIEIFILDSVATSDGWVIRGDYKAADAYLPLYPSQQQLKDVLVRRVGLRPQAEINVYPLDDGYKITLAEDEYPIVAIRRRDEAAITGGS